MPKLPHKLWLVEEGEIDQYTSAHLSWESANRVATDSFQIIESVAVLTDEAKILLDECVTLVDTLEKSDTPVSLPVVKLLAPFLVAALEYRKSLA